MKTKDKKSKKYKVKRYVIHSINKLGKFRLKAKYYFAGFEFSTLNPISQVFPNCINRCCSFH